MGADLPSGPDSWFGGMKLFRWLIFIPAGLFEFFLLVLAVVVTLIGRWHLSANDLALNIVKYVKTMPGINWYFGGDT